MEGVSSPRRDVKVQDHRPVIAHLADGGVVHDVAGSDPGGPGLADEDVVVLVRRLSPSLAPPEARDLPPVNTPMSVMESCSGHRLEESVMPISSVHLVEVPR